jgi:hypothetical protein
VINGYCSTTLDFRHVDRLISEAAEIKLHISSVNWEDGFSLSRLWKLLIHSWCSSRMQ